MKSIIADINETMRCEYISAILHTLELLAKKTLDMLITPRGTSMHHRNKCIVLIPTRYHVLISYTMCMFHKYKDNMVIRYEKIVSGSQKENCTMWSLVSFKIWCYAKVRCRLIRSVKGMPI
jgi:hypothetical protein